MADLKPRRRLSLSFYVLVLLLVPPLCLLLHPRLPQLPLRPSCDFSVVYNKPHKTAGTKIQADIVEWAHGNQWTAAVCSPFEPNLQMHECVPDDPTGCVIVANHMVLDSSLERLFERKLGPNIRWMTSTRSGRERRLSHFLQINAIQHSDAALENVQLYLKRANPWSDFNYMTGELHKGKCPLSWGEEQKITHMVSKYDIVIDADLPDVSNVILRHFGLFRLTDSFVNVKGAAKLKLDNETEKLVESAACVDEEMHRQFRIRMGSLYEKITGLPCNNRSRSATPCF